MPRALAPAAERAPAADLEILTVDHDPHVLAVHARELDAHHDRALRLAHVERRAPGVRRRQAHRAGQRALEGAVHLLFELGELARDPAALYLHRRRTHFSSVKSASTTCSPFEAPPGGGLCAPPCWLAASALYSASDTACSARSSSCERDFSSAAELASFPSAVLAAETAVSTVFSAATGILSLCSAICFSAA